MILSAFGSANWTVELVNHLWQSTLFAAGIWLLTLALRHNHARTRYRLWVLASAKFLVPFSLLISAGGWLEARMHTPVTQPAAISFVMEGLAEPFAASTYGAKPIAAIDASAAGKDASAVAIGHGWISLALMSVWGCGSLLLLAGWAKRWRQLQGAVRAASQVMMADGVPVLTTPMRMEPGVFGIVRPVLLLPRGITERLTEPQLDAILAHELCHVRRRDNLTAVLHMVVEALFWFYPVAWWIRTRLIEERERACDEAVLDSRSEALVYAEGILNVCKFYVEAPMSCVSGVTGSDLKKRIVRIMEEQVARKLDFGRKLLLCTAAILAVVLPVGLGLVHAAEGQMTITRGNGIEGAWQGTAHGPMGDQRMVVQIRRDDSGAVQATVNMLDHAGPGPGGQPLAASDVSFAGDELKFALGFMNARFDGKMSPDHNSINGTWTGQQDTQRLVLERATPDTAWAIPQRPPRMKPMAADANPGIEVATIKPSKPGAMMMKGFRVGGDRMNMSNVSLQDLIMFAYDLEPNQVVNAPSWSNSDTYDIELQPDQPGAPSKDQWGTVIQKLLADRFQIKSHMEQRVLPAYVLTVAKGGPKMTKSAMQALDGPGGPEAALMRPGAFNAQSMSMADFSHSLRRILDRPVVDQTGLSGLWDVNLKWTPDESQFGGMMRMPPPADSAEAPPPLFTAIQEQIGLKLDAGKAQVDVLVIDHVEQPSAN
jgi:uncharacterized protein (TIGR03435 family)